MNDYQLKALCEAIEVAGDTVALAIVFAAWMIASGGWAWASGLLFFYMFAKAYKANTKRARALAAVRTENASPQPNGDAETKKTV